MKQSSDRFSKITMGKRFFVESGSMRWYASYHASSIILVWVRVNGEGFLIVVIGNRPRVLAALVVALTFSARIGHAEPAPGVTFTRVPTPTR
jgi:hypothetical protein